jgi:hypothetical protein
MNLIGFVKCYVWDGSQKRGKPYRPNRPTHLPSGTVLWDGFRGFSGVLRNRPTELSLEVLI